jgi:uncharacterized membrane protein HdeD (DUF308 family)
MEHARVEQFRADIAEMRIKDPSVSRDTLLLRLGVTLMVIGVALTIVAYFSSHSTRLDLNQRDDIVMGLVGVATTVAGAALFLRYSLTSFLRFWLARLIYEQRQQHDDRASATGETGEA